MGEATPRISAAYLETFQGQTVRVLGKVVQLRGDHATIDAGGQMGVILNRVSDPLRFNITCYPAVMYVMGGQ